MKNYKFIEFLTEKALEKFRAYTEISEELDASLDKAVKKWEIALHRDYYNIKYNIKEINHGASRDYVFFDVQKDQVLYTLSIKTPEKKYKFEIKAPANGVCGINESFSYIKGIPYPPKIWVQNPKYDYIKAHSYGCYNYNEPQAIEVYDTNYPKKHIEVGFKVFLEDIENSCFTFYESLDEFAEKHCPSYYQIKEDKYEGTKLINWGFGYHKRGLSIGEQLEFFVEGSPKGIYLNVIWSDSWRKRSWMGPGDVLTMLFEDKTKLVFRAKTRPSEHPEKGSYSSSSETYYYYSFPLTEGQLHDLATKLVTAYKMEFNSKDAPLDCDTDYYDSLIFRQWVKKNVKLFEECGFKAEKKETEKVKEDVKPFVYLMKDDDVELHRIGLSNNPRYLEKKLKEEGKKVQLVCWKRYPTLMLAEAIQDALHRQFSDKRQNGERFQLNKEDVQVVRETLGIR